MKFFAVVLLALFAVVAADVSELPSQEYLPPVSQEYIPPVQAEAEPAHTFGPDGYNYKNPVEAKRRYRYRIRRDVSELAFPSQEYLPPVDQEYVQPIQGDVEPAHTFGPDGYSYKNPVEARRRYRIRRRRDVSELAFPTQEYLPPVDQGVSQEYLPPVEAEPAHTFGPEGYAYKNPAEARRRYRIRRRRDVSELAFPTQEYLPPVDQGVSQEYLPPVEAEPAHTFGPEGYAYKNPAEARRRYRIRRRRDVSELAFPTQEYLPPVDQGVSQEYLPPVEAEPAHTFGPEGYAYKNPAEARRRYRIRRRRDVSELAFPTQEYLPPVDQGVSQEYLPPVEAEPAHTFGPEGYAYKNPAEARRRYRIRRRRDVSELAFPTQEYLPPVDQGVSQEYLPPVEAEPAHTFGPEGYAYKNPAEARRRYRIRRRRDVSELAFPTQEYLPPVDQGVSQEYLPPVEAEPAHTFGPEGYAYKNPAEARRRYRIRYRH